MKVIDICTVLMVSCVLAAYVAAAPGSHAYAQLKSFADKNKALFTTPLKPSTAGEDDQVKLLGNLDSLHVVAIATHPTDDQKLIYADETALYEFDKLSGESQELAGGQPGALLHHRQSQDGTGTDCQFKYITKLLTRPSGVYIFDYDILRKYNPADKTVTTVTQLFGDDWTDRKPVTGAVTSQEDKIYYTTVEGYGHFILSLDIPMGNPEEAILISAGPSLISSLELSADEKSLMIGDVDLKAVVQVNIEDGEETILTKESQDFYPGPIVSISMKETLVVNTESGKLERLSGDKSTTSEDACSESCMMNIEDPMDVVFDSKEQMLYIVDRSPHPTLPTYNFNVKQVDFKMHGQTTPLTGQQSAKNISDLLNMYSRWVQRQY